MAWWDSVRVFCLRRGIALEAARAMSPEELMALMREFNPRGARREEGAVTYVATRKPKKKP